MNSSTIAEPLTSISVRQRRVQPPEQLTGGVNSLRDKVTMITGAVGNLGTATARLFQQAGAKTVLVDRSPDRVREVFKDIADSSDHLLAGGIDLTGLESIGKLVEQTLARFGRVDARFGFGACARIEQARRLRLHDGEDGLAGLDLCTRT